MKQIRTLSNNNTYNFVKGDIVFEINNKKVNGIPAVRVNGQVGQLIINLLGTMFENKLIGGWELCLEEDGNTINAFCVNNLKFDSKKYDGFAKMIKDNLNNAITGKAGKLITDVYQLI